MKTAYLRSVHMPFLFQIQFTSLSVIWVFLSILIGLGYAFLLYTKKTELPVSIVRLLFALRAAVVAFITFLLLAPLVRTENRTVEKPLIFVLLDNSASIAVSKPAGFKIESYNNSINKLIATLKEDFEVKPLSFGNAVKPFQIPSYNNKLTNIGQPFKYITDRFSNRNIGAVILASDGIYNTGANPQYEAQRLKAPIYTIALGDTVPKKDLLVTNVNYNNIVYLGNEFQIEIELVAYQGRGNRTNLSITGKSGTVFSKTISLTDNEFRLRLPATLSANQKGIQKFTVNLSSIPGELSKENNTYTFFVEVVDGRKKVLVLANSPHPDIAALKQSIETNKNYEVKTQFAGSFNRDDIAKADLLILHQLPSQTVSASALKPLINKKAVLFILGEQTEVSSFSSVQNLLNIITPGSSQEAFAKFNSDFYDFALSEATRTKITRFPPLITPFGNYALKNAASILFTQQIGKLSTTHPLLLFGKEAEQRTAVLCGEGLWRWRLEDYKDNSSHQAVDELLSKTIQLIANKEDKRKFRVYPAKNTFDENEHIILNGELYNNTYELTNTPDVSLVLKTSKGKNYSFQFSRTSNTYILDAGALPSGDYSFTASTKLGSNKYQAEGRFAITRELLELRQTTANHQILYNMAVQGNGEMIYPKDIAELPQKVKKNELVKNISYENRRYEDLISLKWIFFILLALLSVEWFSRKRNGEV